MFSFRNGIKLLKMGFEHFYPGVKDADVMRKDRHLAEYNVFAPLQNPACCAPLFYLLP